MQYMFAALIIHPCSHHHVRTNTVLLASGVNTATPSACHARMEGTVLFGMVVHTACSAVLLTSGA